MTLCVHIIQQGEVNVQQSATWLKGEISFLQTFDIRLWQPLGFAGKLLMVRRIVCWSLRVNVAVGVQKRKYHRVY